MELEILSREAERGPARPPLLFVHGAYVGAWCWEAHFLDWFAARGFDCHAVSLSGHGASRGRERLDALGLADYAADVAEAAASLAQPPVLVGHSMGGLVVQKYLERAAARAAVLACPVPAWGLAPSSLALAFARPALFAQIQRLAGGGRPSREALAEALFAAPIALERLNGYYARMQRESRRALADMSGWGLPSPWGARRAPTLVVAAARDALIAPHEVRGTALVLGAEYRELAGLGHALMLDAGWESAAQAILGWLEAQGI
ncbi:MAG TPA: alpha/beta hydrolase [Burkholderiales bacterium]|nr:alpha/beta hydrolase [Burkholderiales bacterium]